MIKSISNIIVLPTKERTIAEKIHQLVFFWDRNPMWESKQHRCGWTEEDEIESDYENPENERMSLKKGAI